MPSVQSLIADFAAAWRANNAARLAALFDDSDPEVTCLLSDAVDSAIGAAACAAAIERRCASGTDHAYSAHDVLTRDLGPDLGAVFFLADRSWNDALRPGGARLGQRIRATLIARKAGAVWRIAHYAEAPLAPLLELQAYYEKVAADGLDAIPPRPWAKP